MAVSRSLIGSLIFPLIFLCVSGAISDEENSDIINLYNVDPETRNPKTDATRPKEVCFPDLGCFTLDDRFKHHGVLPKDPAKINIQFRLNTRKTMEDQTEVINWSDTDTLVNSAFDPSKPTWFIVHGLMASIKKEWMWKLAEAGLKLDDINVVRVGWAGGSQTINYAQAVADSRVVGAEMAVMISEMVNLGANLKDFWLMGHSIGAHICSFVGRRIPGIGRITGMDPAEPMFQGKHVDARLDPTDGAYVDVIHTDATSILALGLGSEDPMGHVDYYPNGGRDQPGCMLGLGGHLNEHGIGDGVKQYVACNHERSWKFMIESIKEKTQHRKCYFKAYPCKRETVKKSYAAYLRGECQDCSKMGCPHLGPDSLATRPQTSETNVMVFFQTLDKNSFCADNTYDFKASFPGDFKADRGRIFFRLKTGDSTIIKEVSITNKDSLSPESSIHRLVVTRDEIDFDNVQVDVRYVHYWTAVDPSTWPIWGKSKIKFLSASISPVQDDVIREDNRREFCFDGKVPVQLEDSKDTEWTPLRPC